MNNNNTITFLMVTWFNQEYINSNVILLIFATKKMYILIKLNRFYKSMSVYNTLYL